MNKKRRIRNWKGEKKKKRITKGIDPKTKEKINWKKLVRMVAPVYNFDPKILPEGSAKLRWVGRIDFMFFWGSKNKQRSCDGRGGRAASRLGVAMSSKRRARSARARTRGQNPLVSYTVTERYHNCSVRFWHPVLLMYFVASMIRYQRRLFR